MHTTVSAILCYVKILKLMTKKASCNKTPTLKKSATFIHPV